MWWTEDAKAEMVPMLPLRSSFVDVKDSFGDLLFRRYGVPIIYIRLYDSKGQLILDPSLVGQMSEKYLSPVPHPIFGSPYLHIHPCKTAEVMEKNKGFKL
ncbi:ATG10L [Lepeophtheirus salmonis]|uniref:ATG10L n=1 Tax=Lepeophtheirus salmonis TaxID=72036 RepID=A0A7R8D325_LEPSM|nr:ATG10L [Lepeophtheirus salmonis]CAF3012466.1 ATG10L [Lepeophtheirus salmonis]